MTSQAKTESSSCPSPPMYSSFLLYTRAKCLVASLLVATIFSLVFFYPARPFKLLPKQLPDQTKVVQSFHRPQNEEGRQCDLFQGQWVRDPNGSSSRYTGSSCTTIPEWKNCFKHGRKDTDFLKWSWKPGGCELPSFDPKAFLEMVRGKTLTFVGDSVARNHMDSLLCLLATEEVAVDGYKDSEDRNRIWLFPAHNFTLKTLWTTFLVEGQERIINGSASNIFDLHLDKLDENWAIGIPTSDIIIISGGHWFFRQMYLHRGSDIVACVSCNEPNITDRSTSFALKMAVRSALSGINRCKNCKSSLVTMFRTFSPAHFENGAWNTGGTCNRTSPWTDKEIDSGLYDWEMRNVQVEEIERAIKARKEGKKFRMLDVTRIMLLRPDGHLGAYNYKNMKGQNDCIHWCLPGPIDVWNDLLLAVLKRLD